MKHPQTFTVKNT